METRMPVERIDRRMIRVWRLTAWLAGGGLLLAAAGLLAAWYMWSWPWWLGAVAALAGVLEIGLAGYVRPPYMWRTWRYEIREDEIDLLRGFWTVRRTVIPMVRVQHVDLKMGPVMRRYGLAGITFSTAAGSHEIPGLDAGTADEVRQRISGLARLAHEDI
ncbi:PH domain-containing protein [Gorillibacterium sp. sgz5001074]|uniref:PH domain-containing protein n=1 Tax=Gorillibacterium sp. sgz5001074 TaxID=3446695 RepID=UPI003F6685E4